MTALVARLGFVPMSIVTGTAATAMVIGEPITSTALTLFLLAAGCGLLLRRQEADR
jgi:Cu/Ag efflux pump CusA